MFVGGYKYLMIFWMKIVELSVVGDDRNMF